MQRLVQRAAADPDQMLQAGWLVRLRIEGVEPIHEGYPRAPRPGGRQQAEHQQLAARTGRRGHDLGDSPGRQASARELIDRGGAGGQDRREAGRSWRKTFGQQAPERRETFGGATHEQGRSNGRGLIGGPGHGRRRRPG